MKNELQDHLDYAADSLRTQIGIIQDEIDGAEVDYQDAINLSEEIDHEIDNLKHQLVLIRHSMSHLQSAGDHNLHQGMTQLEKEGLFTSSNKPCCDPCDDQCCGSANPRNNYKRKLDLDQLLG